MYIKRSTRRIGSEGARTMLNRQHLTTLVFIWLAIVLLTSCGNTEPQGTLVTETYIVRPGDTLWTISEQFMQKNTYGPRDIREFYHGVIELNYDAVFKDRKPYGLLMPGDRLQINYWK